MYQFDVQIKASGATNIDRDRRVVHSGHVAHQAAHSALQTQEEVTGKTPAHKRSTLALLLIKSI